jgi:hypothetical protein
MRRNVVAAMVLVLGLCASAQADGWFRQLWHNVRTDCARNNAWPEPFNHVDHEAATAIFDVQIAKGMQVQNTLGAYHFDSETGQITEAGKLKVEWILTKAPARNRTVYVERGLTQDVTSARMQSVRGYSTRFTPTGMTADFFETTLPPRRSPADPIVGEQKGFADTAPQPRLAAPTGDTSAQ